MSCNDLLNSTSDIPSRGPVLCVVRATEGLTAFRRSYIEQTPHRAIVICLQSLARETRLANSTANRLLASDAAGPSTTRVRFKETEQNLHITKIL